MSYSKTFLLIAFLAASIANSQNVFIPDTNFKKKLIADQQLNSNNDGEIQVTEAATCTILNLFNSNISDLTGISSFTNLTKLLCSQNKITQLDLSGNINLTEVQCLYNQLTSLDLSKNQKLFYLYCNSNNLATLNLSNNTLLDELGCYDNKLTQLDLSKCINLRILRCANNQLAKLDLKTNKKLLSFSCDNNLLTELDLSLVADLYALECTGNQLQVLNLKNGQTNTYGFFDATNNPMLKCIQVDAPTKWRNLWTEAIPQGAEFSMDCNYLVNGVSELTNVTWELHPNPNNGKFKLKCAGDMKFLENSISIRNIMGQVINILSSSINEDSHSLDISEQAPGIYFLEIVSQHLKTTKKIIIQ